MLYGPQHELQTTNTLSNWCNYMESTRSSSDHHEYHQISFPSSM